MMVQTTEGFNASKCQSVESNDPKVVANFLKGNCLTAGFSIQFAVNPATRTIVEIIKNGKLVQRDLKPLIEAGFTVFMYSWAWAPKHFQFEDGQMVEVSKTVDLVKLADVLPWKGLLG